MALSIHDLTRRSTGLGFDLWLDEELSIHDLTRRSTNPEYVQIEEITLSIHDLTRRSTNEQGYAHESRSSFNSRPHKEVDIIPKAYSAQKTTFQFTTSQGGRPRPLQDGIVVDHLSIHDLTRRSTKEVRTMKVIMDDLSIHDLTRRSTPE